MRQLPKSQITIRRLGDDVIVGAHENHGYRHYTKFRLADLPNDLATGDDLERFGIDVVDRRAVEQL